MVLVAVLGGILFLWRRTHRHENVSSIATYVVGHATAAALVLLLAALIGSTLVTWTRVRAAALGYLAVVVLGTGAIGGFYVYGTAALDAVNGHHDIAIAPVDPLLKALGGGPNAPAIALVAGYDVRAGTGANSYAGSNSDTLMLLRADPKNHTLSLLSFPRDLNVPIYCKGNTIWGHDRVNSAWAHCGANGGPYAALDTMEHLTGLEHKINYLITLDFHAFKEIVNRLHGVYLNVDRRYYIPPNTGTSTIDLHPGYEKLDGGQALEYVRFRHFDSDIYRNGRQQLFLEALKQRLKSTLTLSNILEVPQIIKAVKGNLAIEKSDGSDVSPAEINSYLGLLLSLPPGHEIRNAIPLQDFQTYIVGGADELTTTPQAIATAVHSFLHPVVPAAQHPHKGKTPKLPHKTISVLVLNAGNIAHEAARTSSRLHKQGFTMKHLPTSTPANAPSKAYETVIYYDASQPNGQKAAEELAPLFSHHRIVAMTSAISSFATQAGNPLAVVAIGTSFHGKLNLPHTGGPPGGGSTANAQVTDGITVTLSAVRSLNGPAHFPLMVPHKVANGSTLSTMEGARIFKPLRGKQEAVLTFNLYNGVEYWQVEESNWNTEPLLASPTAQFTLKGRTYLEFTSGGKIQTIAFRQGKNAYWVQNTILNSLSNSTMIAIAEGLQPLH